MEKENKFCVDEVFDIREKYGKLKSKHNLPDFEKLNDDFDIAKIDCDSLTLLRDVRKAMILKFSSVMQFVELLINPTNGSMFNMFLVKGINGEEKEILKELFGKLGEIEIDSFGLDVNYNKRKEADFVKEKFKVWQNLKPEIKKVMDVLKINWSKSSGKKQRSYFG